jgi:hypothetical protein
MYIYDADLYCDSCGEKIKEKLDAEGQRPTSGDWDSDEYPKHITNLGASDNIHHCGSGAECEEAVDLGECGLPDDAQLHGSETRKVGAVLNDELTEEGVSALNEMLEEKNLTPYQVALHDLWRVSFSDYL